MVNIFSWLGGKLSSAAHTISHALGSAGDTIKSGVAEVYDDAKSGVKTIFTTGSNLANKVEDDTIGKSGLAATGLNDFKSIISMPLVLIGGGVAAFLLFSGKNSSFQGTASIAR